MKEIAKFIIPKKFHESIRSFFEKKIFPNATYNQDGLISIHNCDFMNESKFSEAYKSGQNTGSWGGGIHWRVYFICWAAKLCMNKPGDFVECGVNKGGFSMSILKYTEFMTKKKKLYLLDTFSGLVETQISDEERKNGVHSKGYEDVWDEVQTRFKKYNKNVKLIRGTVPETLAKVDSNNISFLSIDMNCAEPEIKAIEFFWNKLVSGAIIILDDYGWPGRTVQKNAFDNFAKKHKFDILSLPTGQGLIIKP